MDRSPGGVNATLPTTQCGSTGPEWFLYDQESPVATGGRGLARGRIYDRGGNLLVSVVQEGLFRRLGA
jgi:acyl-CoA thioesterase